MEHPVFDLARDKMKRFITELKNHKKPLKTRCIPVLNVGATIYFLLQNRSGLPMREHLYSMNVVIVTINGEMADTHYATNLQLKFKQWDQLDQVDQPYQSHQTF